MKELDDEADKAKGTSEDEPILVDASPSSASPSGATKKSKH